jgi:hypothetical protein
MFLISSKKKDSDPTRHGTGVGYMYQKTLQAVQDCSQSQTMRAWDFAGMQSIARSGQPVQDRHGTSANLQENLRPLNEAVDAD